MSLISLKLDQVCQPVDSENNIVTNTDSLPIDTIAIFGTGKSYQYYLDNFYPLYSKVWLFPMERGIINDDIYFTLNDRLMNDPGINIILFGIQHYTKFRFKSSHLLLMDDMVLRTQMFQLRPRAIVDTITDMGNNSHVVVKMYVNNVIVGIISRDAMFTPQTAISGFAKVYPGFTMASALIGGVSPVFQGTASTANNSSFIRYAKRSIIPFSILLSLA